MEDQSERVVFFEGKIRKKGAVPVVINITIKYSYKYMKLINRLTSDPPPEKKGGVAPCPLKFIPTLNGMSAFSEGKGGCVVPYEYLYRTRIATRSLVPTINCSQDQPIVPYGTVQVILSTVQVLEY